MTLTDYMNPEKFPATSQKGLSPEKQLRLDAFNYDQLEEAIAGGHQMDEEQIQIRKELQAKRPWMAELTRHVAPAKKNDKKPEITPAPIINSDIDETPVDELIDDDGNYAAHLGSAIMAIVNDKGLTTTDKRKTILGALKLLGEDDKDEDIEKMLGNAIMEIINDDDLSTADKRKKVLGTLKLMDDDEIPGIPPPQTIYTDMNLAAPTEAFDQASLDRLPSSDRPFIKLSTEQTKTMCEQVIKILKVTREQEERDKQAYREMYGEEMPEM